MKKQHNLFFRTLVYSLLIILISLLWYFGNTPLISNFLLDAESKTYDLFFVARNRLNLDPKPPKNILIVGIDAASISKVGIPWPWPRQFHASLVDALTKAGSKFIVFDIIFDTISPLSLQTQDIAGSETIAKSSFDAGKEDDNIFANSLKKAMNVFLACEAEPLSKTQYQAVLPISNFVSALNNDTSYLGNSGVTYDRDNFVRKVKVIYPEFYNDPAVASSITFRVAQKYFKERANILPNNSVQLGKKKIPKEFLINYYGPAETIETIPYWKALELIYKDAGATFKDKVVFIGRTKLKASIDPFKSVRSPDSFATPYASLTPNFSGVEIQASILGNLLESSYIIGMNQILLTFIMILTGLFSCLIVWRLRTKLVACFYACLLLSGVYLLIAFSLFILCKISIPPTFPIYGTIIPVYFVNFLDQYFIVDRARRRQAKVFRQLVPTQVADEIEEMDQEQLALGGTRREITVLFTDIKNFTGMCEKYSPETIVHILNEFFTEMVKTIHKHNGLVDKFIGDAIMVLWGSPKVLDTHIQANMAIQCALAMKQELKELNNRWHRTGLVENLSIRIGINTDEAITGNVGSLQRIQFSAIGDGVNVASRLEAVNKVYGTEVLLSDRTTKLLEKTVHLREIDTVLVPGKDIPINIYELISPEDYSEELLNKYSDGLQNYRNKNWSEAVKLWQECVKIDPKDNPSQVMLQRTLKLNQTQPLNDWKPIWIVENK
ncbi:MAG: adenylate/guanylate cyclase domain-containing protein [Candidatus Melainabacteria bacterium]|nr:adenylate/guanylate cyclase domain-containing protein [Candidatus Melainabacteria bacterium]